MERIGENSIVSQDKKITADLVGKIRERFPLRGKITNVSDEGVELNIGSKAGVKMGSRFRASDRDVMFEKGR